MDRKANYFFTLSLIAVFVLQANASEHIQIILAALLVTLFCGFAFLFRWLTLDGVYAAVISGTVVFGLGGYAAALVLLLFFLSSSLISQKYIITVEEATHAYAEKVRRDGIQVWSNGFWFTLFFMLAFAFEEPLFVIAALGAIATATADTWATELGSKRFSTETYLMNGLKRVRPGTDGGISVPGTIAALAGSLIISLASVFAFSMDLVVIFPIFMAGFLGCLTDSYFGATYQREDYTIHVPVDIYEISFHFDNNLVNWLSSGIGSLLAIILNLLLT